MNSRKLSPKKGVAMRSLASLVIVGIFLALIYSADSSTGSCVGTGGEILLLPVSKNDWTRTKC